MNLDTLRKIRDTNSSNEKIEIATNEFTNEHHRYLEACFNDDVYGISSARIAKAIGYDKKKHGTFDDLGYFLEEKGLQKISLISYMGVDMTIDFFIKELKNSSGNNQIDILSRLMTSIQPELRPWYIRILLKNPRLGMNLITYNKIREKHGKVRINKFFVKLATKLELKNLDKIKLPAYEELKYDGERCIVSYYADTVYPVKLKSRRGKDITKQYPEIVKWVKEHFRYKRNIRKMIFDGEIISDSFNNLQSRMNRKEDNLNDIPLQLVVYDILQVNTRSYEEEDQIERRSMVEYHFPRNCSQCRIVESTEEIVKQFNKVIAEGEEGLVIKEYCAMLGDDRKNWYKLKPKDNLDLKIVELNYGTGKYKDMISTVIVETKDGKLRSSVSGMTDEMKHFLTENQESLLETIAEIEYVMISKSKTPWSLRHPSFVRLRDDKKEADIVE